MFQCEIYVCALVGVIIKEEKYLILSDSTQKITMKIPGEYLQRADLNLLKLCSRNV